MSWEPIETAPKPPDDELLADGIFVWSDQSGRCLAFWDRFHEGWCADLGYGWGRIPGIRFWLKDVPEIPK